MTNWGFEIAHTPIWSAACTYPPCRSCSSHSLHLLVDFSSVLGKNGRLKRYPMIKDKTRPVKVTFCQRKSGSFLSFPHPSQYQPDFEGSIQMSTPLLHPCLKRPLRLSKVATQLAQLIKHPAARCESSSNQGPPAGPFLAVLGARCIYSVTQLKHSVLHTVIDNQLSMDIQHTSGTTSSFLRQILVCQKEVHYITKLSSEENAIRLS